MKVMRCAQTSLLYLPLFISKFEYSNLKLGNLLNLNCLSTMDGGHFENELLQMEERERERESGNSLNSFIRFSYLFFLQVFRLLFKKN